MALRETVNKNAAIAMSVTVSLEFPRTILEYFEGPHPGGLVTAGLACNKWCYYAQPLFYTAHPKTTLVRHRPASTSDDLDRARARRSLLLARGSVAARFSPWADRSRRTRRLCRREADIAAERVERAAAHQRHRHRLVEALHGCRLPPFLRRGLLERC